jgi:hypothetical protein
VTLTPEMQAVACLSNAFRQAFASLNKCLLNNGALKPGQLSNALSRKASTIQKPSGDVATTKCFSCSQSYWTARKRKIGGVESERERTHRARNPA